jgi:hypothetical protein
MQPACLKQYHLQTRDHAFSLLARQNIWLTACLTSGVDGTMEWKLNTPSAVARNRTFFRTIGTSTSTPVWQEDSVRTFAV